MRAALLVICLAASPAFAVEPPPLSPKPQPAYLKGGRIDVKLKSKATYRFSADKWKVVPRPTIAVDPERIALLYAEIERLKGELAQAGKVQSHALPPVAVANETVASPIAPVFTKNRITGLAGFGPAGLRTKDQGDDTMVRQRTGLVAGLQYSRIISGPWSLAVSAQSNVSGLVGLGYDF